MSDYAYRGRGRGGADRRSGFRGHRGGGRGRESTGGGFQHSNDGSYSPGNETSSGPQSGSGASTHRDLDQLLRKLHNQNYGAYKSLNQRYTWTEGLPITLFVDWIQGDAFASPSRFRVRLSLSDAGIPPDVFNNNIRVTALCDYLNRGVVALVRQWRIDVADSSGNYHGPKGGDFNIYKPKQQVLDRSSCVIGGIPDGDPYVEIRFTVTLPAFGRSINGDKARELLTSHLPKLVQNGLLWQSQDHAKVYEHLRSVEVQQALRDKLHEMNLVAFIGNESILPRASGADPGPMKTGAIGFRSPASLSISINTGIQDSAGENIVVTGMGIPRGITVITGGGFHGKSTLLEAIQFGIYNVIPGDGRERVAADPCAFKVRAEDGRSVVNTDISPFISALPGGRATSSFTTADASGSTSMAANIQEALEIGATTLIIDEDTSATNFLVRDSKMHELVISEPITPLVSKVTAMFKNKDVSTIIVVGGCGDYLYPATTVIGMESYIPHNWTSRAHEIASRYPNAAPEQPLYGHIPSRVLSLPRLGEKGPRVLSVGRIQFRGDRRKADVAEDRESEVDLSALEQFVEEAQTNLCADVLEHIQRSSSKTVKEWAVEFDRLMAQRGTNIGGDSRPRGNLAWTRPLELLAVANRVRGLTVTQKVGFKVDIPTSASSEPSSEVEGKRFVYGGASLAKRIRTALE